MDEFGFVTIFDIIKIPRDLFLISIIIIFVIYNIITFVVVRCQASIGELKDEIMDLRGDHEETYEKLMHSIEICLKEIGNELKFGKGDIPSDFEKNNERITLYIFKKNIDDGQWGFCPVRRYSEHGNYDTINRVWYPQNEGAIGEAWDNTEFFYSNYPDPITQKDKYYNMMLKCGLSKETVDNLEMHPRLIFAHRYSYDHKDDHKLIIVVESTFPDRYSKEKIIEAINTQINHIYIHLNNFDTPSIYELHEKVIKQKVKERGSSNRIKDISRKSLDSTMEYLKKDIENGGDT